MKKKLAPELVFTPRSPKVNSDMYINRPSLESRFVDAMKGSKNVIIHGDSGCGKSWLYKYIFEQNDISFIVANLANAPRLGGVNGVLSELISRNDGKEMKEVKDGKKAGAQIPGIADGGLSTDRTYTYDKKDPFVRVLKSISGKGTGGAVLVFDNYESIYGNDSYMSELASLLTLCDDDYYAQFKVKILLVGIPSGLRECFNRMPNLSAVANRLVEMPEVARLDRIQSKNFASTGFDKIDIVFDRTKDENLLNHVYWVTDGIPQRLHEYCLEIAKLGIQAKGIDLNVIKTADANWIGDSLSHNYSVIENSMNERDTKVGRRNQILYCLGQIESIEMRYSDLVPLLHKNFPTSKNVASLDVAVGNILSELASLDSKEPILKRNPKGDAYVFADPKFKICIRAMLKKKGDASEKVEKIALLGS